MVLLVVDAQSLITTAELYQFDVFVENVSKIIKESRAKKMEVIYIRHDDGPGSGLTKGDMGFEVYDKFKPEPDEKIFDKQFNSAFKGTGLLKYLQEKNEQNIIIVGLQTDYCIDATIKCGFEHGFHMIVPAYTNSTFDNEFMSAERSYQYYNETMWKDRYAECITLEETLHRIGAH
jgi:nicotinamidase-related amidase